MREKLGVKHNDEYYIDASLMFGAANGTANFQRISNAVRCILSSEGIYVWNYMDDIFTCLPVVFTGQRLIGELGCSC